MLNCFFFQSIFADPNLHRTEFLVISLENFSRMERQIKAFFEI